MTACTPRCQKCAIITLIIFCFGFGTVVVVLFSTVVPNIVNKELVLANNKTRGYNMWKETPLPMFMDFYMFDWVNSKEVIKDNRIKPRFEEKGPYVFSEHHIRTNVSFNDNGTITFETKRIWHFVPEKSNGTLADKITNVNPILATVAYFIRYKHYLVKRGLNFFLTEERTNLTVTKSVEEFLFAGYDDPFIHLAESLNISEFKFPFKKFGWFVDRNGSSSYDGVYTIYDGVDNIQNLGVLTKWNYENSSSAFPGECGFINGTTGKATTGEIWYPPGNAKQISIFASDICSTVTLTNSESDYVEGISGYKFVGGESVFDNGTKSSSMACYNLGNFSHLNSYPSGVRNASTCKFGAPAFISYPHFYQGDPYYREAIDGMTPDPKKHDFFLTLEPTTGVPLHLEARLQLNFLVMNMHGINLLENVNTTLYPMLWFNERVELTKDLAGQIKMIIVMSQVGIYTGYGVIAIGVLLLIIGAYVTFKKGWKGSEEDQLLPQQSF